MGGNFLSPPATMQAPHSEDGVCWNRPSRVEYIRTGAPILPLSVGSLTVCSGSPSEYNLVKLRFSESPPPPSHFALQRCSVLIDRSVRSAVKVVLTPPGVLVRLCTTRLILFQLRLSVNKIPLRCWLNFQTNNSFPCWPRERLPPYSFNLKSECTALLLLLETPIGRLQGPRIPSLMSI